MNPLLKSIARHSAFCILVSLGWSRLDAQGASGFQAQPTQEFGVRGGVADFTFAVYLPSGGAPITITVYQNGANDSARFSITSETISTVVSFGSIYTVGTFGLEIANLAPSDAGTYTFEVVVGGSSPSDSTSNPVALAVATTTTGYSATHGVNGSGFGYVAGQTVTMTNTIAYTGSASALSWSVVLPAGWSFASSSGNAGNTAPAVGQASELDWAWSTVPASPVSFTYTLNVPAGQTGTQQIAALVGVNNGTSQQVLALPDPLMVPQLLYYSTDESQSGSISLLDLTRAIELYNTHNGTTRTGAYTDQPGSEDGFAPNTAQAPGQTAALNNYYTADESQSGSISLLDLTRVIELYNYHAGTTRTGQYHPQAGTEDGFAPGP
ncbi:MAG: hypothetical protein ABSA05_04020 [Opitutaceae bacterium]|jgi:hypothetical protein